MILKNRGGDNIRSRLLKFEWAPMIYSKDFTVAFKHIGGLEPLEHMSPDANACNKVILIYLGKQIKFL